MEVFWDEIYNDTLTATVIRDGIMTKYREKGSETVKFDLTIMLGTDSLEIVLFIRITSDLLIRIEYILKYRNLATKFHNIFRKNFNTRDLLQRMLELDLGFDNLFMEFGSLRLNPIYLSIKIGSILESLDHYRLRLKGLYTSNPIDGYTHTLTLVTPCGMKIEICSKLNLCIKFVPTYFSFKGMFADLFTRIEDRSLDTGGMGDSDIYAGIPCITMKNARTGFANP